MVAFLFIFINEIFGYIQPVPANSINVTFSSLKSIRFGICSNYWEQQTNAILNMWSFQKWAYLTGFRVVDPFADQSTLRIPQSFITITSRMSCISVIIVIWISGQRRQKNVMESHRWTVGIHLLIPRLKEQWWLFWIMMYFL